MKTLNRFILLFFATILFSCSPKSESIKLGAIIPLTGKLSEMGEAERKGMNLAIEDLKKEGVNLDLIIEDSKSNAKDGVTAARKLIDIDQCNLLLTSTTGTSTAVEPITTEKKINLIAFCMDPDISGKSVYVTRLYEGVESEAIAIQQFLKNDLSAKNIGLFYNRVEVWDKINKNTLKPFLEKNGKKIVFMEDFAVGEKDFKNIVLKMKESKLDHLVLLGYGFEFPILFQELKSQGLLNNISIIGGWGFLYSKVEKEDLEGVLVAGPEYIFKNAELAAKFKIKYENIYKTSPNFDAAMAYNTIYTIGKNLKFEDLKAPIKIKFTNQKFKGVVGDFSVDDKGNMILRTSLGKYKNGIIISE
jgi:branched-chain amino acid transport system substrate-binding protein